MNLRGPAACTRGERAEHAEALIGRAELLVLVNDALQLSRFVIFQRLHHRLLARPA